MLYSLLVSSTTVLSYGRFGTFVLGEIEISTHSLVFHSLNLDIIPFLLREKKEHSRNVPALSNSTIETQFRHRDGTFA